MFNFPIKNCGSTDLECEKVKIKNSTRQYRVKVVTSTYYSRLNRHQLLQLQGWRVNCDINVVIDYHSCIEYLTKYTEKEINCPQLLKTLLLLLKEK